MSEGSHALWNSQNAVDALKIRRLAAMSPGLATYLAPGAKVLDVGCGPGPITIDIAELVHPGQVTGVDWAQNSIAQAQALAREAGIQTVTFQVGDAYALEFADATFDLACSLNLLVHLREPVRALIEQRRVTKPGGWVVASSGDFGTKLFYPPSPTLEKIMAGMKRLCAPDSEVYANLFLGRESRALFVEAGLLNVEVRAESVSQNLVFPGTESFHEKWGFIEALLDPDHPLGASAGRELRRVGVLDDETVRAAREEIAAFVEHPHALYFSEVRFVAAGRVP